MQRLAVLIEHQLVQHQQRIAHLGVQMLAHKGRGMTHGNIMDGGRDYEVTVDFEGYGVKKMFASFAKLKRI